MRIDSAGIGWSVKDGEVFFHLPKGDAATGQPSWGPPMPIDREDLAIHFGNSPSPLAKEREAIIITLYAIDAMRLA